MTKCHVGGCRWDWARHVHYPDTLLDLERDLRLWKSVGNVVVVDLFTFWRGYPKKSKTQINDDVLHASVSSSFLFFFFNNNRHAFKESLFIYFQIFRFQFGSRVSLSPNLWLLKLWILINWLHPLQFSNLQRNSQLININLILKNAMIKFKIIPVIHRRLSLLKFSISERLSQKHFFFSLGGENIK